LGENPIVTQEQLRQWWNAIAPACTADLEISIDLWALLQRSWSLSPNGHQIPIILGQTYEAELAISTTAPHRRKRQGSYYTPEAIAQFMVEATLGPACSAQSAVPTILDPACGGGVFLVVAYRYLAQRYGPPRPAAPAPLLGNLFGIDIDPNAVAVTRLALSLAVMETGSPPEVAQLSTTVRCGNALVDDAVAKTPASHPDLTPFPLTRTQFDVVLGNPPYLDSEAMTRHLPHWRTYCRSHYQTARGNWDLFGIFVERALQLCRQGGWHSFVVPNKLLSADYASGVRSLVGQTQIHQLRDYSRVTLFQAAVYPLVYVTKNCVAKNRPVASPGYLTYEVMGTLEQPTATRRLCRSRLSSRQPWGLSLSRPQSWLARLQTYPRLDSAVEVAGAASVSEAYQLQPLLQEQAHPSDALRFVNSGTIDRYSHAWGRKPLRYLGHRYSCPVVSRSDLATALPRRYQQSICPKLIIAGLTQRLECIWDGSGGLMAGKSTTVIVISPDQGSTLGPMLLGLLNSSLLTAYFQALFGGNALRGGYLRVGPPQVRSLPLPPGYPWQNAPPALMPLRELVGQQQLSGDSSGRQPRQALDLAIDALVYDLYEISDFAAE